MQPNVWNICVNHHSMEVAACAENENVLRMHFVVSTFSATTLSWQEHKNMHVSSLFKCRYMLSLEQGPQYLLLDQSSELHKDLIPLQKD